MLHAPTAEAALYSVSVLNCVEDINAWYKKNSEKLCKHISK